jgi:hypothetical protein
MNRFRLAAPALILGLSLLSGCCNIGHGEILSRLGFGPRCCETCGSAPSCCEGPDLCDAGGPTILGPGGGPQLAPPPQRLPGNAVPVPADPAALSKSR